MEAEIKKKGNNAMGVCVIVGAGTVDESEIMIDKGDFVIGADGGLKYLEHLGVQADMALGDFDSLGYLPEHEHLVIHPVMKDDTDMMLAVKEGLNLGYRTFRIYGGLGGRLDHTLANLQTLCFLSEQEAEATLIGEGICVRAVTNGEISFDESFEGIISVFCLTGEAKGVTLTGLKYSLDNGVMTSQLPLGVSNEFIGKKSTVRVTDGTLIVIWSGNQRKLSTDMR